MIAPLNDEKSSTNIADETTDFRGIWYEKQRGRWRVRLYCRGRTFHLSYHEDYRDAIEVLVAVREHIKLNEADNARRKEARCTIELRCTTVNTMPDTRHLISAMRRQLATEKPTLNSRRQCPKHCATHKSRKN